jgi:hypothetical protein
MERPVEYAIQPHRLGQPGICVSLWTPIHKIMLILSSVFIPNFTGSTGFGQTFVDAVARDWGGAPFIDMRAGYSTLLAQHPEIDCDRAAVIGGSWGGYAVNLIQGHPEWRFGFKALVCHDGEFDSTYSGYSVDEQFIVSSLYYLCLDED